jgi:putative ABC transport system substrate-binding protein
MPTQKKSRLIWALAVSGNIPDGILLLPEALSQSPSGTGVIINFSNKYHIPVGGGVPYTLDLGAIFSFDHEDFEMGELAAQVADKILKGVPAGTIPLVTPEIVLSINYRAAQNIGLTVPEGMLAMANEIIR